MVTRVCVCLSVSRRMPTLLHGPGCNLGNVGRAPSCALLGGFAIDARVSLLYDNPTPIFAAWIGIFKPNLRNKNMHVIETTASIPTKFYTMIKTTTRALRGLSKVQTPAQQIQDGEQPPYWRNRKSHISATVWPIDTKFGNNAVSASRTSRPLKFRKGAQQLPTFLPMSIVAKLLDWSKCHLVRR